IIVAGKSSQSLIIAMLRETDASKRMPLDAKPLPEEDIQLIARWIDAGAKEGTEPEENSGSFAAHFTPARVPTLPVALQTKVAKPPQLELVLPIGPLSPAAAVAFSPDGKLLAAGSYGRVTIWNTSEGRPVQALTQILGAVNDLKFSPDGSLLAVAGGQPSARGDLRLFSTKDWKLVENLGGHLDVVSGICFTADGKTLASASFDKTVRIWDLAGKRVKQTLTGHSDFVYSVAFSPKGDWLVSASKDRTVRLCDTSTSQSKFTFSGMEQDALAVAVSPDGGRVVSSGYEPSVYWWNPQTGEQVKRQGGHDVAVHELAFDRAGKLLASAGGDKTVRLWNGNSGEPIRSLPAGSMVYSVAVRPDGQQVAAGCFDGTVRIWETATGRQLLALVSHSGTSANVEWLALAPEGYVAGSDALLNRGQWRSAGQTVDAKSLWPVLRRPSQIAKAFHGEKIAEPVFPKP
ncbi:MAG TPA: WD40 repeat domain-containing protein, partial [Gemmataceae bacterium]|nr:WD40 repeat domain-containing protein [Gemmataceae bacterium]